MTKKRKIVLFSIGILLLISIAIGVSFAYWSATATQESINKITTDCLNLALTDETEAIHLENAYPVPDEEIQTLNPYTFKIENVCNTNVVYDVNLEVLEEENRLSSEYISTNLNDGSKKRLNSLEVGTPTIGIESYKLTVGTLAPKESVNYTIKLWMDESVTTADDVVNKSFKSKIVINGSISDQVEKSTIMVYQEGVAFWGQKENITKIVIEDKLDPKLNAIYTYDVSETQDKSVMSYLVENESNPETYTMYLQGYNGIQANPDSSNLFLYFTKLENIEGLEYFDTSNVTNMEAMFANDSKLIQLNLSSFDTSNVNNMRDMFWKTNSLNDLDISNFDTSNVVDSVNTFLDMPLNAIIKVKNEVEQQKILNSTTNGRPSGWTEDNIIINS